MSKTNKPNILIVDNSPAITGAYNSIISTTNALQKQFTFYFALPSEHLVGDLRKDELNTNHIPFLEIQKNWRLFFYLPVLLLNTYRIKRIIRENDIRVVHINDLYNMCGVLLKIFNPHLKIVYHVRLLPTSYAKRLYFFWKKRIEKYADKIICVSETVASNFSKEKTTVIFDSISKYNIALREEEQSKNKAFKILYMANYIEGKGHKQAIEAYHLALPHISNTQLIFYGGTLNKTKNQKFKDGLMEYTNHLGLSENIIFNDFAIKPEQIIMQADLMLNFSESESFSMTTLEALVYGTPIIATACGGPSEIIEHDKSGILVPVNDAPKMAQAMVSLINNAELRASMVIEGKKRVKEKFDFKTQINLLHSVYQRLLK